MDKEWKKIYARSRQKPDVNGQKILHLLQDRGGKYGPEYLEQIEGLIEAGASLSERTEGGDTALTLAADRYCPELIRAMIAAGADINARHNEGHNALDIAAAHGHFAMVKALLDNNNKLKLETFACWDGLFYSPEITDCVNNAFAAVKKHYDYFQDGLPLKKNVRPRALRRHPKTKKPGGF